MRRGVTVSPSKAWSFLTPQLLGTEAEPASGFALTGNIYRLIQSAILGITALLLGLFVIRPLLARPPALPAPSAGGIEVIDGDSTAGLDANVVGGDGDPAALEHPDQSKIKNLREVIRDRSEDSAEVLRRWIENYRPERGARAMTFAARLVTFRPDEDRSGSAREALERELKEAYDAGFEAGAKAGAEAAARGFRRYPGPAVRTPAGTYRGSAHRADRNTGPGDRQFCNADAHPCRASGSIVCRRGPARPGRRRPAHRARQPPRRHARTALCRRGVARAAGSGRGLPRVLPHSTSIPTLTPLEAQIHWDDGVDCITLDPVVALVLDALTGLEDAPDQEESRDVG